MENGQHRTVKNGIEEFVGVPGGGQRAGLGLTVAHHTGGDQVGVVHYRAEGVGERVTQFAALVDGAGGLGAGMGRDPAGEVKSFPPLSFITITQMA